ncbi:phage integrase N-terminal SAM-like domain-containing protein [Pseudoalteromonas luteoviolacea]|uniref:phage integrase N-terminal SAM-like domain-containing protein n=1 Tax=Pseudoalteromonas luteoviolacea TaxID=43657 RepID=UPI0018C863F8
MYTQRYAKCTISCYLYWITAFIQFHNILHAKTLCEETVEQFLSQKAKPTKCDSKYSTSGAHCTCVYV